MNQPDWHPLCGFPCDDDGCVEPCEWLEGHQGNHKCGQWQYDELAQSAEQQE